MSDNFTAGVIAGIFAAVFVYPIAVVIGAASVPFHRGSDATTATAGFLWALRMSFYLTLVSIALALWGLGMLVETALVGTWTVTLILLALGYAYWRR